MARGEIGHDEQFQLLCKKIQTTSASEKVLKKGISNTPPWHSGLSLILG